MKTSILLKTSLLCIVLLCYNSCSKEEFTDLDQPILELDKNFLDFSDRSIVFGQSDIESLIVQKEESFISLKKSEKTDSIEVGSILITESSIQGQDVLFRKVVEVNRAGDDISCTTEMATMIEAFDGFYLNSRYSDVILTRNFQYNDLKLISDVITSVMSSFTSLWTPSVIPFNVTPLFELRGEIEISYIHPNTLWTILGPCKGLSKKDCYGINGSTRDTDKDGIYDEVERYFQDNGLDLEQYLEDNPEARHGILNVSVKGMGIKTIGVELSKGGSLKNLNDPDAFLDELLKIDPDPPQPAERTPLAYKYFPVPALNYGFIGVCTGVSPNFRFGGAAQYKLFASLAATFPNTVDVLLGKISIETGELIDGMQITNNDKSADISYILEDMKTEFKLGISGEISGSVGIAFGGAVMVGEPFGFNIATGLSAVPKVYAKLSAEGALVIPEVNLSPDLFDQKPDGSYNYAGEVCVDLGFELGVEAYFDDNTGIMALLGEEEVDYTYAIPPQYAPFSPISFLSVFESYSNGKGICLGFDDDCPDPSLLFSNIFLDNGIATLEWNLKLPEQFSEFPYKLSVKYYNVIDEVGSNYSFNSQYVTDFVLKEPSKFNMAREEGKIELLVEVPAKGCNNTLKNTVLADFQYCDYFGKGEGEASYVTFADVAGKVHYYYTSEEVLKACKSIENIATVDEYLSNECFTPTGYLLRNPEANNFLKVYSDRVYFFTQKDGELRIAQMEIEYDDGENIKDGPITFPSFSKSVYAVCNCK